MTVRLLGAVFSSALGFMGADQVSSGGPDFTGIALLITAISGLIATITGLILAFRRKPMDPRDAVLLALAERLGEPDAEEQ